MRIEERRREQRKGEEIGEEASKPERGCNMLPDTSFDGSRVDIASSLSAPHAGDRRGSLLFSNLAAPRPTVQSGRKRAALSGRPWLVSGCS